MLCSAVCFVNPNPAGIRRRLYEREPEEVSAPAPAFGQAIDKIGGWHY